jgi:hypothetical protein
MATKGTFNTDFNHAGGGVYAMQWEREKFIKTWIFVQPNIPTDIVSVRQNSFMKLSIFREVSILIQILGAYR